MYLGYGGAALYDTRLELHSTKKRSRPQTAECPLKKDPVSFWQCIVCHRWGSGWPDWENVRLLVPLGNCSLWTCFWSLRKMPHFLGYFFYEIGHFLILQKCVGQHFGRFFVHKLIRSPCRGPDSSNFLETFRCRRRRRRSTLSFFLPPIFHCPNLTEPRRLPNHWTWCWWCCRVGRRQKVATSQTKEAYKRNFT
jgi:hypothetical protein